jgi:hypothetical protein
VKEKGDLSPAALESWRKLARATPELRDKSLQFYSCVAALDQTTTFNRPAELALLIG